MPVSTSHWLDRFFESYYRHQPVSATFIGKHEYDNLLPDYSGAGVSSWLAESQLLLEQLDSGSVAPPTTKWESIDRLLARNALLTEIWELSESRILLDNPCLYTGEATFSIVSLFLRQYQPINERTESAVQRLQLIPEFLEQGRSNITSCPSAWVDKAVVECDGAINLLTDGIDILINRHGASHPDLRSAASQAKSAFEEFRRFLLESLAPSSHSNYGVGAHAFDNLLKRAHCLDIDTAAVAEYAFRRLEEARESTLEASHAINPEADPASLLTELGRLHPSVEAYYATYQTEWDAARSYAISQQLLTWPDYPIEFQPIPDWARSAAPNLYFLFYRAPAPFDPHVTQRYLVTPIEPDMPAEEQQRLLEKTNLSQIRLNHVIHHGGIGHHVQNWWAYRAQSRIGQMAAVDCSLRIAMLCGGTMAEGWACYATDLMNEAGYLTPLENLAEQQGLARMAGRAIVDAGLHSGTMSFDDAVNFYHRDIGMPESASHTEAVKNSMFPGAAMMYLFGTDMIHELRDDLRQHPGFQLNQFHDDFLSHGSIPVALTAALMKDEEITIEGYVGPSPG